MITRNTAMTLEVHSPEPTVDYTPAEDSKRRFSTLLQVSNFSSLGDAVTSLPGAESTSHQQQTETGSSCLSSRGHMELLSPVTMGSLFLHVPSLSINTSNKTHALELHERGMSRDTGIKMPTEQLQSDPPTSQHSPLRMFALCTATPHWNEHSLPSLLSSMKWSCSPSIPLLP